MKRRNTRHRLGTSATEVIVAATLLLGMIGLVVPMTVRAGKILRDARHFQVALNELSNQFEYLSSLNNAELATALTQLQVSDQARRALENARLEASLSTKEDGARLTLSLRWDRGVDAKPVQLTGWLNAAIAKSSTAQKENNLSKEIASENT